LAARVESGDVPLSKIAELGDEEIIEALVKIKGVGRWTAQMFLMFRLGRLDVLPTVDLGINKAIMREYGMKKMPKPAKVLEVGAAWSPYATVACWYLWRSLDTPGNVNPMTAPATRRAKNPMTAPATKTRKKAAKK
ncbi:MAG: DNA-3-methyladenine glycosylase 2 family protein, partial [Deltaproteobacteria bacterium]|nr:DNA-3-methyladenine glycosylase 2 family protein [Deltaproteobacteria bacterium]